MLPSFLYSTYTQYKEDTSYVVNWLAQTAKSRGYAFPQSTSTTTTPKLIPKKVIKNKKKALQAEQDRQAQQKPYTIPTKELLSLAQYISKCDNPPVKVPNSVISTIVRTVKARQCTNDYYTAAEPSTDDSDGHAPFIDTLKSIHKLLSSIEKPSTEHKRGDDKAGAVAQKTPKASSDMDLNALSIADSDSNPSERSCADDRPPVTSQQPPRFSVEPMKEQEKLQFATKCLFLDIRRIITHVTMIWGLYARGKAQLVAVTVVSECAISLVERLEEDYRNEFPNDKDVQQIPYTFYQKDLHLAVLAQGEPEDPEAMERLQRADITCCPMFKRLMSFLANFNTDDKPTYIPHKPGSIDIGKPRSSKTIREKIQEDDLLFQAFTPLLHWEYMHIFAEGNEKGTVLDSFLRGLKAFALTEGKLCLWHIVAGQCFLEAMHATIAAPDKAFREVQALARAVKSSASKTVGIHCAVPLQTGINLVCDRVLVEDSTHRFVATQMSEADPRLPPRFCFLRQNPIFCGMHAFSLLSDLHESTIRVVNFSAAIPATAHLVNAVQQEGICSTAWPEMERMIQIQGEQHLFVGDRPKTVDQYSSRYKLARGISATTFASNRRSERRTMSKREPRVLKYELPTLSLLSKWWTPKEEPKNLAHIEKLLNERFEANLSVAALAENLRPLFDNEDETLEIVGVQRKPTQKPGRKAGDKRLQTRPLTPWELLIALEHNMVHETPMLKFDYLDLHSKCWRLLERIATEMNGIISTIYGEDWLGKNRNQDPALGHDLVPLILDSGSEISKIAREMLRARDANRVQCPLLEQAGKIVEDFLRELEKERPEGPVGQFDEARFRDWPYVRIRAS